MSTEQVLCPCGKRHDGPGLLCDWCSDPENAAVIQYLKSKNRYLNHYEPHVSPSQLATWTKGCKRAWALDKIGRVPRPGNKYSERGTAVHGILEDWILLAKPPDLATLYGQIAFPALRHIPAPRTPGLKAEREVRWWTSGDPGVGTLWVFLKDLELPGEVTRIWDYKSTSNLLYALTPEKLEREDPQGLTYAAHAIVHYRARQVNETWLYLDANKPHRCHPVKATHYPGPCLERFALLDREAAVMIQHRRAGTDPATFPANPGHCPAYGGCPYKNTVHCTLTDEEVLMSQLSAPGSNVQSFLASIGQAQGAALPPAAAVPQPVQAFTPPVAQAPTQTFAPPAAIPAMPPAIQFPPAAVPVEVASAQPIVAVSTPNGIRKVEAPAPPAPFLPPSLQAPGAQVPPAALPFGNLPSQVPAIQPDSSQPAGVVAEAPRRKRRTKAEMAAARGEVVEAGGVTVEVPEGAEVETSQPVLFNTPQTGGQVGGRPLDEADREQAEFYDRQDSDGLDPLVREIALAMACNPGYCGLDAVTFADRARVLADNLRAS